MEDLKKIKELIGQNKSHLAIRELKRKTNQVNGRFYNDLLLIPCLDAHLKIPKNPDLPIGQIIRRFGAAFVEKYEPDYRTCTILEHISNCKTEVFCLSVIMFARKPSLLSFCGLSCPIFLKAYLQTKFQ